MNKSWSSRGWQLKLAVLALVGIIGGVGDRAIAQEVTADSSLSTKVTVNGATFEITNGTTVGGTNLFHSFSSFSVPSGGTADFLNAPTITNILARVTGGNPSDIQGLIRAQGSANLFLMNPSGILFGPDAQLDIGGSFVATTANGIQFPGGEEFSLTSPVEPQNLLLTVNPSAFLFNQIPTGAIENKSIASAGLHPSGFDVFGLRVPDGRSLLLVGGDVSMDGGGLNAFGGRVELGGVVGSGTLGLNVDGSNLSLSFPDAVARSDVSLTNGAGANVTAGGGGSIAINARNLDVLEGSFLYAGIEEGLGEVGSQAGDITLNATEATKVATNSFIYNYVGSGAVGNAGSLNVETAQLSISEGAQVADYTAGEGNAGNLTVRASEYVEVVGTDESGSTLSFLGTDVFSGAKGNGGDLTLETRRLNVSDGGQVSASTSGEGDAGNLTVRASDSVELSGESPRGPNGEDPFFPSGLFDQVNIDRMGQQGAGKGGNLTIETERLSVSDGSKVQVSTFGTGNSGDLLIRATDVEVFETPRYNFFTTGVFAEVADPSPDATGIPGDPERKARGNGGNLTIEAERLSIRDGSQVSVSTRSEGNAGRLLVRARDTVEVLGTTAEGLRSSLSAIVRPRARGTGGNLTIETGRLSVRDGGGVSVGTFGEGDAGALRIHANESVEVVGTSPDGQLLSELSAAVGSDSTGSGGSLTIETGQLSVTDGATLTSRSEGQGSAGNINIDVRGLLQANDGEISTSSTQAGGGNITITAQDILLHGDTDISTSVFSGVGGGGNIDLTADSIIAFDDSDILAFAQDGQGGNITLNTPAFFGFRYQPAPPGTDPETLDGNDRVDINASGAVAGVIVLPDVSFIQNSLNELPENPIDTNTLIANSCIARSNQQGGSFMITGAGGLPTRPGDAAVSPYPTGTVRPIPSDDGASSNSARPGSGKNSARPWKLGDPIVEPQGVYQLTNGQLVLSRECS